MTTIELEAYDAMMKDRDKWKSLYFTMRELSDNATEIAERRERERDEARRIAEAYRDVWEMCAAAVETCPNPDPLPWPDISSANADITNSLQRSGDPFGA
jgi:hypothetical protein